MFLYKSKKDDLEKPPRSVDPVVAKAATHGPNLYHIRIIKTYLEYLEKYYPELDIDAIISYAGLTRSEIDDDGYWFTQEQADRFHEIVDQQTGHINIARKSGQYSAISASLGLFRQYIFGLMKPSMAYELLGKIGSKLSRGTSITIKKIGSNKVEAVCELNPGVDEKPYQCQNRIGTMEAVTVSLTGEYAKVDHPECIHEGASCCRYIISWHEPLSTIIKRIRSYIILFGVIACFVGVFSFSPSQLVFSVLTIATCILSLSWYVLFMEKKSLIEEIQDQGQAAEQLIAESDKRYNDAELVQKIGHAMSTVTDIDDLLKTVMSDIEKYLDYDRGLVLLSNQDKSRLIFRAGYGYTSDQKKYFQENQLHLDNPVSKGPFVLAFKNQTPYLINDIEDISHELSQRSRDLAALTGTNSFICVPIIYENESMGVLSVVNIETKIPPKQSDVNLLMGIAPQIAISINNARFFERLQTSEEKYRVLVESANSIILRFDTSGNITFANTFAQDFYGYSQTDLIGQNALGLIIPEKDTRERDLSFEFSRFLRNPEDYKNLENENIRRNGEKVWVSWSNKAIYDKEGKLSEILCVGNDLTDRKRAEYDKKRLEMQLQRSQKMEAIGTLAGGVAHDLNNILSGIVSYPEILLMEVPDGSPMKKSLEVIKRSGEKAAAIVQDLLTLARRGVNVSNVLNLNSIVEEYFKSPEYAKLVQYHQEVQFDFELDNDLLNILGSGVHLSKTLMNLISNAAEAMPNGGTISVSTKNKYVDNPIQGFDTIGGGEYVVLSIQDSGIGISPEDVKRIFEPFYSKKVMGRSGTGLGMAVIWSTVKDHRGYIDVHTELGEGTRFDLYFPITRMEIKAHDTRQSIQSYKGTEKILVVDDVLDQRDIARQFLQKLGYRVDVVCSGEEAVEYMKKQKADLLILDMIMDPGMDGFETYEKILDIRKGQKAIIVSGYSESDRVKGALGLGAGAYIKKPYVLNDIARAVRTELDR
jgi:PAS domain S-box-containing protein